MWVTAEVHPQSQQSVGVCVCERECVLSSSSFLLCLFLFQWITWSSRWSCLHNTLSFYLKQRPLGRRMTISFSTANGVAEVQLHWESPRDLATQGSLSHTATTSNAYWFTLFLSHHGSIHKICIYCSFFFAFPPSPFQGLDTLREDTASG